MAEKNLAGQTVLLADDVITNRSAIAWMLKDFGNPQVFQAADGKAALRIAASGVYFVISDFNMPELHGLQLLKAVRAGHHGITRSTPFTLLTGYADKSLVDIALALDVNAFLVKPVSKDAFLKRLAQVLEQSASDGWLKPIDQYAAINVESALRSVTGGSRPSSKSTDPPKVAKASPIVDESTDKKPPSGTHGEPTGNHPDEQLVSIETIPWNAILTRDIHTPNGKLFMRAGADLTPRVIALLTDLDRLNSPVRDIWISVRES